MFGKSCRLVVVVLVGGRVVWVVVGWCRRCFLLIPVGLVEVAVPYVWFGLPAPEVRGMV